MVGSGTESEEFPSPCPSLSLLPSAGSSGPPPITTGVMDGVGPEGGSSGPPSITTGVMEGVGPEGGSSSPPPITTGGMEGVDPEGGFSDPPPMRIGGMEGVGSEGGFKGASKTPAAGSSGDVFPCGTSDNTLAHRVLVKFVPSVINLSPLATFNLFFVQKISPPTRYET